VVIWNNQEASTCVVPRVQD